MTARKACLGLLVLALILSLPVINRAVQDKEPDRVEVQHILISFKGADERIKVTRSQEEAETLAKELLFRARRGEDFDTMMKEYSDDSGEGIYRMSNTGVQPDGSQGEMARHRMVKSFGDVSFGLELAEIGMAAYHPQRSKFGWHIIKRIK
jgi:parvulin-like peptidyl-prolyl isomerase